MSNIHLDTYAESRADAASSAGQVSVVSKKMETIKTEISNALKALGDSAVVCRELPEAEGEVVFRKALAHFVASGDQRWWWEDFRQSSTSVKTQDAFRALPALVPDKSELIWFIAEDDQLPFFPVYESTPEAVSRIVGECYGFEYYLIQKQFKWLLCENHHDMLIGIGEPIETGIKKLETQQGT